jgi:hypothetical protein
MLLYALKSRENDMKIFLTKYGNRFIVGLGHTVQYLTTRYRVLYIWVGFFLTILTIWVSKDASYPANFVFTVKEIL